MYSILRKPFEQSDIVNFAARASAKRNVRFRIEEKEETKHAIPERESKYSETDSETDSENSYSDWDNYESKENKMKTDEDTSSDYVPTDEEMEVDDDPTSDYVPSESEESEVIEEEDDFDEKVFNILSSLKYKTNTKSKYLFDWGSEYCEKLDSVGALKRKPRTRVPTFKRRIKCDRNWMNLLNKVRCEVIQERLS